MALFLLRAILRKSSNGDMKKSMDRLVDLGSVLQGYSLVSQTFESLTHTIVIMPGFDLSP